MTYRANRIRTRLIQRLSEEWTVELDPDPYRCTQVNDARHDTGDWWCALFSPRPGYEQDRSKYEH